MTITPAKIVVALSHDELTPDAAPLRFAVENLGAGATIHIVHVIETPGGLREYLGPDFHAHMNDKVEARLPTLRAWATSQTPPVEIELRYGSIYREVLAQAKRLTATHIVIGSHSETLSDFLLGTNAAKIVRHAECSVTVLRGGV